MDRVSNIAGRFQRNLTELHTVCELAINFREDQCEVLIPARLSLKSGTTELAFNTSPYKDLRTSVYSVSSLEGQVMGFPAPYESLALTKTQNTRLSLIPGGNSTHPCVVAPSWRLKP